MTRCASSWQVEALRDGRLTDREQRDFAQHLRSCDACTREQRALDELGDALRSLRAPPIDERALLRRRQALLERADAARHMPRERSRTPRRAILAVAFGMGAIALLLSVGSKLSSKSAVLEGARVEVDADDGAIYRREQMATTTILVLEQGTITVRVQRESPTQRVLVQTPDGEMEDVGTVFAVAVEAQHTKLVRVDEGRVAVRLKDREAFILQAGESYGATVDAQVTPMTDAVSAPASAHGANAPSGATHEHRHRSHRPARAVPDARDPHSEAAHAFSQAVERLEGGDAQGAAGLFHVFLLHYQDSAYAEDAAFLRVVALARAGETKEVRVAAQAYLQRYPGGFRAKDVERLLGDGGAPHPEPSK